MSGTDAAIASVAMVAALLLGWGGGWLILKRHNGKQGALMLLTALVLLGNVLIWSWPAG